jgi:hypothetical protein
MATKNDQPRNLDDVKKDLGIAPVQFKATPERRLPDDPSNPNNRSGYWVNGKEVSQQEYEDFARAGHFFEPSAMATDYRPPLNSPQNDTNPDAENVDQQQ